MGQSYSKIFTLSCEAGGGGGGGKRLQYSFVCQIHHGLQGPGCEEHCTVGQSYCKIFHIAEIFLNMTKYLYFNKKVLSLCLIFIQELDQNEF